MICVISGQIVKDGMKFGIQGMIKIQQTCYSMKFEICISSKTTVA